MKKSAAINIPLRTPATWTADDRVTTCFECRTTFSFLSRKHHCRVCGRIFCNECSKYKARVPSFIRHFIASSVGSSEPNVEKRVCIHCFKSTLTANRSKHEIYIMANLPLLFGEFLSLRMVNKRWNGAVKTLLGISNSIQYKLPHTTFTKIEKSILRTRFKELSGHSAWIVQIIKALGKIPKSHKMLSCDTLFCKKGCQQRLNVYDLLELYTHKHRYPASVDTWAANAWALIDIEDHIHLMPWWVHIFRYKPYIATKIFIHCIKDNIRVVYSFLFECKLQAQNVEFSTTLWKILNECLKIIDKKMRSKWHDSDKLLEILDKLGHTEKSPRREYILTEFLYDYYDILCPWNPEITIQNISMEMERLKSASKPLKMSLYTDKGTVDILYKTEDVRKDRMTMATAYWIEKTTEGKVEFTRYAVMPVKANAGIIEMVKGATTLYDIKHKHGTTLQNFILDRNSDLTVVALRERFIKSVAAACVLSYVLGVGDRHLENMLVTDDGKLIHVDFFYLLGDDPKHVKTEMRITPDMLDALGGRGSQTFTEFQELCSDVYTILRSKSSFWYSLLMYLADASPRIGLFGGNRFRIQQHVLERLCPGELDNEACMQIVEIVKRSSQDSWRVWGADKAHELAKMSSTIFNLEL